MTSEREALTKALLRAADALGLSADELAFVIGGDIATIEDVGLDPSSPAGLRALLLIRVYVRLTGLVGDSVENLKHWMSTHNHGLGAVPADLLRSSSGLEQLVEYLEAFP